jgi:ABC-type phosphonate transport system ATPase subunit
MWVLVMVLIVALMIPISAILLESPLGHSIARRLAGQGEGAVGDVRELQRRVEVLESELEDLTRSLSGMRDELQFVQRLLEDPKKQHPRP